MNICSWLPRKKTVDGNASAEFNQVIDHTGTVWAAIDVVTKEDNLISRDRCDLGHQRAKLIQAAVDVTNRKQASPCFFPRTLHHAFILAVFVSL